MVLACTGIFYLIAELRALPLDISAKLCVSSSNFLPTSRGLLTLIFNVKHRGSSFDEV